MEKNLLLNISRSLVLLRNCTSNRSNKELLNILIEVIISDQSNQEFINMINKSSDELKNDINNIFNDFDNFFIKGNEYEIIDNTYFQILLIKLLIKIKRLINKDLISEASDYADAFHYLPEAIANNSLNYKKFLNELIIKHIDNDMIILLKLMRKLNN